MTTSGGLVGLPDLHRDPFDRMLVSQGLVEDLTLVSGDDQVAQYPGEPSSGSGRAPPATPPVKPPIPPVSARQVLWVTTGTPAIIAP